MPLRREPTVQELFDRVLSLEAANIRLRDRIASLEASNDHLRKVTGELDENLGLITDLLSRWNTEKGDDTTRLYAYLTEIHDLLWPVVHKVFPNYADDQAAIDRIIPPDLGAGEPKLRRPPGSI